MIASGRRRGLVTVPRSKSHEHRLLIANFLAGDNSRLVDVPGDAADILATKRCLRSLLSDASEVVLDCGESGSTRRFLGPVAAAMGKRPQFLMAGRLAQRPQVEYADLRAGTFELAGDVSSQFVTGLLFALPLLKGDSRIRFTVPLQSSGYVEMTLRVLAGAGIHIEPHKDGFYIPGSQRYRPQPQMEVEGDWSGAAFWYAMNAMGSEIEIFGLSDDSAQPDRKVGEYARMIATKKRGTGVIIDVADCPDIFPALSIVAGASSGITTFIGTKRLRLKESDRAAAMFEVLARFGVQAEMDEDEFRVIGRESSLNGGAFRSFGDHRIAMSIAVGATVAEGAVAIDDVSCVAKSYPSFFEELAGMTIIPAKW